jgi:hypothetical protein
MLKQLNKLDELSRRQMMQGIAGMTLGVGASLANLGAETTTGRKRVVRIFLGGGMSHLDSFDPKPQSPEVMGDTKPLKTNTDQEISSYFPKLSQMMDKLALIRSMSTNEGDHRRGNYLIRTSYNLLGTIKHPDFGAWMHRLNGKQNDSLPASIGVRSKLSAGFLGTQYDPFFVGNPKNALAGLFMEDPNSERNLRLLKLMTEVRTDFHKTYRTESVDSYRGYYNDSIKMMNSPELSAFDLSQEDKNERKKYNITHGDSFLLARRLLEAKVQYVSLSFGGWDNHDSLWSPEIFPKNAANLDLAIATFLQDLYDRGMYEDTIVTVNTEFGRTPKIDSRKGRGHYPKAFSSIIAGAGVKNGIIYGKTDDRGETVVENPVSAQAFNATLAKLAGLNLEKEIYSPDNRPFTVARGGKVIKELMV